MTPLMEGKYRFRRESIMELRKRLGISQTDMARGLGVPVNTLYRWEAGITTPDADALAAIYSVGMERGISPGFFVKAAKTAKKPAYERLIVAWDFQSVGVAPQQVRAMNDWLQKEIGARFQSVGDVLLKAFAFRTQSDATDELQDAGWRVWDDDVDMDDKIVAQIRSDCLQEPSATILLIITKDGNFAEVVRELKQEGARVYVLGPNDTRRDLIEVVGTKRHIPWPANFAQYTQELTWWVPPSSNVRRKT